MGDQFQVGEPVRFYWEGPFMFYGKEPVRFQAEELVRFQMEERVRQTDLDIAGALNVIIVSIISINLV